MIHYHGTPISGENRLASKFLAGRHALVSFQYPQQIDIVAEVCQSFVLDNGAFTVWKQGGELDFNGYVQWVDEWHRHPGFDWALIPDVIGGSEEENDDLLKRWHDNSSAIGVPVWHLHESFDRLLALSDAYQRIALGSSGVWKTPGSKHWWTRMRDVMNFLCDEEGRPPCKLHGLRMLNPRVFPLLPLASADSTNAGMNAGSLKRFGTYVPVSSAARATVIADRIEAHNSAQIWINPTELEEDDW